jgi:hypothetical protein
VSSVSFKASSSAMMAKKVTAYRKISAMPAKLTSTVEIGASDGRTAEENVEIAQIQARHGRDPFYLGDMERATGSKISALAGAAYTRGDLPKTIAAMDAHAEFVVARITEHFKRSLSRTDVPMAPIKPTTVKAKRRARYLYPNKPLLATLQLRNCLRGIPTKVF